MNVKKKKAHITFVDVIDVRTYEYLTIAVAICSLKDESNYSRVFTWTTNKASFQAECLLEEPSLVRFWNGGAQQADIIT